MLHLALWGLSARSMHYLHCLMMLMRFVSRPWTAATGQHSVLQSSRGFAHRKLDCHHLELLLSLKVHGHADYNVMMNVLYVIEQALHSFNMICRPVSLRLGAVPVNTNGNASSPICVWILGQELDWRSKPVDNNLENNRMQLRSVQHWVFLEPFGSTFTAPEIVELLKGLWLRIQTCFCFKPETVLAEPLVDGFPRYVHDTRYVKHQIVVFASMLKIQWSPMAVINVHGLAGHPNHNS